MVTPAQRHEVLTHLTSKGLSQRSACRWSGISRSAARYRLRQPVRDAHALAAMQSVMAQHPRFGYRRVAVLAPLSFKRAWRLWKQQEFAVQPARVRWVWLRVRNLFERLWQGLRFIGLKIAAGLLWLWVHAKIALAQVWQLLRRAFARMAAGIMIFLQLGCDAAVGGIARPSGAELRRLAEPSSPC